MKQLNVEQELQELVRNCRHCLFSSNQEMIQPCQCSGSQRYIHLSCLKKWIQVKTILFPQKIQKVKNLSMVKCENCQSGIQFKQRYKITMKSVGFSALFTCCLIMWNLGLKQYSSTSNLDQKNFCKLNNLLVNLFFGLGNLLIFFIIKLYFLTTQIQIIKKEQNRTSMVQIEDFCRCCFKKGNLINVCDCVNPRKHYHKDCLTEELSRYLKRLSNQKDGNLSCKYCRRQFEYSVIRKRKLCKKDILILGIVLISLILWNGIQTILSIQLVMNKCVILQQMAIFYVIGNVYLIKYLIFRMRKVKTVKEVKLKP